MRQDENGIILEDCIQKMASKDKHALEVFYEKTKAPVYGFSLSILKNVHDAEDVLQDTYIQIYQAAFRYKPNGKPMPWVFEIAKNLCLMKLREQKKTAPLKEEDFLEQETENFLSSEERILLDAAMQILGDDERQIFMLHAVAGFKHREIAKLLGLVLPTVLSKYHRAKKKLMQYLKEET